MLTRNKQICCLLYPWYLWYSSSSASLTYGSLEKIKSKPGDRRSKFCSMQQCLSLPCWVYVYPSTDCAEVKPKRVFHGWNFKVVCDFAERVFQFQSGMLFRKTCFPWLQLSSKWYVIFECVFSISKCYVISQNVFSMAAISKWYVFSQNVFLWLQFQSGMWFCRAATQSLKKGTYVFAMFSAKTLCRLHST